MLRFSTVFCILVSIARLGAAEDKLVYSVDLDFGEDRGQSFGSLFELTDEHGRAVAGAGFIDVYNTRFRTDRFKLQFYVKPAGENREWTVERLPRPGKHTGLYLFDQENKLYGWTGVENNLVYEMDAGSEVLVPSEEYAVGLLPGGMGKMVLAGKTLAFLPGGVSYDGRQILAPPETGVNYSYYYAENHLFFYHRETDADQTSTKIYAVAWKPGDEPVADYKKHPSITCRYPQTSPFSWGQHNGRVVTVGNYGGIYTFAEGRWIEELEGSDRTSYQVYSMMNYDGKSYMAQYPTGNLFEYTQGPPRHLKNWPPVLEGVHTGAREVMALGIYQGDMIAGVWPWAEIWGFDKNTKEWTFITRGFTHPPLTDKKVHPYEEPAVASGLVMNHWGQRITSMVARGRHLYLATSSKSTDTWKPEYDFLNEEQRKEYGMVVRLTAAGVFTAHVPWSENPVKLRFTVSPRELSIELGGKVLGTAPIDQGAFERLKTAKIACGRGAFGPSGVRLTVLSNTSLE